GHPLRIRDRGRGEFHWSQQHHRRWIGASRGCFRESIRAVSRKPAFHMTKIKRVAILQSSYMPWKGYFDIINDGYTFVFYDDVQFTRQDWRSRNRIIANGNPLWLTVPTGTDIKRLINEVRLSDSAWQRKHWSTIRHAYTKSPYFRDFAPAV